MMRFHNLESEDFEMREQEVNAIIELLNSDKTDVETGEIILKHIDRAYNCLGSYSEISKSIFESLSKVGKERFYKIWCMAGFELAYSYIREDKNPWDDRKKASMQFAFRNVFCIEKIFNDFDDMQIHILSIDTKEMENELFDRWFSRKIWNERKERIEDSSLAWLYGFVRKWLTLHSTIKQSYYGGVYNGVVTIEKTNQFEEMSFPFI